MTYVDGTSRWAGRVYDGPLEGSYRDHHSPYFEFALMPRGWEHPVYDLGVMIPPDTVCYRMTYRWSNPLRAWVLDWRTAPQPAKARPRKPIYRKATGDWMA